MAQRGVGLGGRRLLDRRTTRGPAHPGRVARVTGGWLGAVGQLLEPGVQHLEHRDAVAVRGLMVEHRPQRRLVESPDAVAQLGQRQLVIVGDRQVVALRHALSP
ncbi:hypothetical protein DQP55_01700 [Mycolicibacterium sp. GF69]|nr:hypothetical protein DQP55_01700 [Mycolicibacterium sp. GF69]